MGWRPPALLAQTPPMAQPDPATKPERLVVVAGTGTEVGKTWVGAALLRTLRDAGWRVAARKPAQSYAPDDAPSSTDAAVLGLASGEPPTTVCVAHRWYPVPMAPPMAARALGRPPFTLAELAVELEWPEGPGLVGLIETAGGVRSPLADDGDTADLVRLLEPDAGVLVADAGLGTINAVRSSAAALVGEPLVVVLNRFAASNELHEANRQWLVERDGFSVVVVPGDEAALAEFATRATRSWGGP